MKILKTYKEIVNESNSLTELSLDQWLWCTNQFGSAFDVDDSGKVYSLTSNNITVSPSTEKFPVNFANISGDFTLQMAQNISSLEGSPEEIGGSYTISSCPKLESLKGISKNISGSIIIENCPNLKSLDGIPLDFPEENILFFRPYPYNYNHDKLIYNWKNGITLDDINTFEKDWEI